ncbi:MAG TPA: molybdenum cofactor biosynthesis protein MoaE [Haliangiales bacterium]|nr:molybdenum cofactor biosynthesis protein MoaE [Haliangiales bacterium]
MKIHVRYFAVVRERLRRETEDIELPPGATAASALDALAERHEPLRRLRPWLRLVVNQEAVADTTALADGDELALLPPVAGGQGRLARIVTEPPSLPAVIAAVERRGAGGIVTFVGMVRDHSQGHAVERLEYEAFAEMADKVFCALCDEIEAKYPGARVALEHRVGALGIGDVAVAIAVSAPHRGEAFRACEETIRLLKERAPIWKKEFGPDGATWVGLGA